ncbi:anthranilate synthase component 1 [Natronomonas pharaonis DSM 2160]|uniref:Anthranilate synthase component 1 n=1 Tax=Natronomonas pharaonis (strain ATCC 35678 / DSM 2160 / CIP 103997 / JCM 8858 / NBRC 14720 / NCIMB 2260 / Gabara) TaxID=348780 RepID=A0A1U7EX67_NATPD|nr:anthranilate synthase component I [Natronomonas pharaonis]CAI49762.1 anthranilate synthase component 1 [Natronomonas pharaonis DSM 2160]
MPVISRSEFVELAGDEPAVIRLVAELDAAVEPLEAYAALTGRTTDCSPADHTFLLESAEKVASSDPDGAFRAGQGADRHARYSFVGYDPAAVVTVDAGAEATVDVIDDRYEGFFEPNGGDTVATLRETLPDVPLRNFPETDRQTLQGGLVGFLAYDAVYDLWLDEVGVERPDSRFPDAQFMLTTKTLVFDDAAGTVSLVCTPLVRPGDDPGALYDDLTAEADRVESVLAAAESPETGGFSPVEERAGPQEAYEDAVETAKEHVLDGDIYQGVISRTRELDGDVDTLGLYRALRDINPSPYMYLLDYDDLAVVGASPETLVSVRGREVMSNPIAGTCPRGESPVEDRRLAGEMLADDKERAEHTMLVDLARNDVRRVSEAGSVRVEEFMNVLKYSHVQHIESTVTGRLREDCDAFDATRASFPAGTLSGAPKIRAMEIIDDLERTPRGVYGGGVGYYSWSGDADFAIVIRTATVERGRGVAGTDRITVQAGAGIVADSDPESEYEETEQKMDGVLEAIEAIETPRAEPEDQR